MGDLVSGPAAISVGVRHACGASAQRLSIAISKGAPLSGRCIAILMGRDKVLTGRDKVSKLCRRGGTPQLFLATTRNGGVVHSTGNGCDMALAGAIPSGVNSFTVRPTGVRVITFIRKSLDDTRKHIITGTVRRPLVRWVGWFGCRVVVGEFFCFIFTTFITMSFITYNSSPKGRRRPGSVPIRVRRFLCFNSFCNGNNAGVMVLYADSGINLGCTAGRLSNANCLLSVSVGTTRYINGCPGRNSCPFIRIRGPTPKCTGCNCICS